jgi:hypothetical protein
VREVCPTSINHDEKNNRNTYLPGYVCDLPERKLEKQSISLHERLLQTEGQE